MPQPTQTTSADAAAAYFKNPLRLSMASSRTNFGRQLAFLPRGLIQHLEGLYKARAYCPRPERLAPRLLLGE